MKKYMRFFADYAKPRGPRLAYIGGVYGSRNLGDEALRLAAAKLFSRCSLLEFPRKRHLANLAKLILPVFNALLAGGTLINQREEWLSLVSNYVPVIPNFIVFGTGVAHPSFWPDRRRKWAELLRQCRFVGVRGPLSAQLLTDVQVSGVEIVGDPVLVFASDTWDQRSTYIPNSIGLNIGWDRASQWGIQERIFTEAVKLATLAKDAGWRIRWFIVCPADIDITSEIAVLSGTNDDICHIYTDPLKYINLVKSCSVFAGMRLHSVVLATCAYVPPLVLEYRPKCLDYMLSIRHEEFVIRTDMFQANDVWEKACHINANRNRFSEALYMSIKPLRDVQLRKAHELQDLMLT